MTKNNQKRLVIFFIVMFGLIASGYNSFLKPLDSMIINFIQGLENPMLTSIYLNTTNIADQKPSAIITAIIVIILFLINTDLLSLFQRVKMVKYLSTEIF